MSKQNEENEERFLILKFSKPENLKKFYSIFQESGLGELHKVGSDPDGRNMQKKKHNGKNKSTWWSKVGASKYDDKDQEKPSLV